MEQTGRKNTLREIGRIVIFILLLILLLRASGRWFFVDTPTSKTTLDSFYAAEENSLDMIYLGNSGVYRFYQPALAWEEYGIVSTTLATPSQPAAAIRYLIEECEKTQSPQLYVIDLRAFSDTSISNANMHNLFDFMAYGWTRFRAICDCIRYEAFWFAEIPEYFFPIIRFHERWSELESEDLQPALSTTGGSYSSYAFLHKTQSEVESIVTPAEGKQIAKNSAWALDRLLDYLDKQKLKAVFVCSPMLRHEEQKKSLNTLSALAAERGYTVLNFNSEELPEAAGLTATEHFMDNTHTNISGSILFTHYLGGVLQQLCDLPVRREGAAAEYWQTAYDNYAAQIGEDNELFFLSLCGREVALPAVLGTEDTEQR